MGGSYSSQSPNADSEATVNLYPESIAGQGKSAVVLYTAPGLKLFCDMGGNAVRGADHLQRQEVFAVVGTAFNEYFSNGTFMARGTINADLNPE